MQLTPNSKFRLKNVQTGLYLGKTDEGASYYWPTQQGLDDADQFQFDNTTSQDCIANGSRQSIRSMKASQTWLPNWRAYNLLSYGPQSGTVYDPSNTSIDPSYYNANGNTWGAWDVWYVINSKFPNDPSLKISDGDIIQLQNVAMSNNWRAGLGYTLMPYSADAGSQYTVGQLSHGDWYNYTIEVV